MAPSAGTPLLRRSPRKKAAPADGNNAPNLAHLLTRAPKRPPVEDPAEPADGSMRPPPPRAPAVAPDAVQRDLGLWATKHEPRSEADIVVAKKKLEELRAWLRACDHPGAPRACVLVGPPGCGKSAALRLVARELGRGVREWRPPAPTLWEEHKHAAAPGAAYRSKLDDFEAFLFRAARYSPLGLVGVPSTATEGEGETARRESNGTSAPSSVCGRGGAEKNKGSTPARPPVLLVEDLPSAGTEDARRRVLDALARLNRDSRAPACVVLTEETGDSRDGGHDGSRRELSARAVAAAMTASGAAAVHLNPATRQRVTKALFAVARAEGIDADPAVIAEMVENAEGDVRSALAALQLAAAGVRPGLAAARGGETKRGTKRKKGTPAAEASENGAGPGGGGGGGGAARGLAAALARASGGSDGSGGSRASALARGAHARDRALSAFRALGKILYNKRGADAGPGPGLEASPSATAWGRGDPPCAIHPSFRRDPMPPDPEMILGRGGLDARRGTDFLFENYPDFLGDDAAEDAARVAAYLSDAAWLAAAGFGHGGSTDRGAGFGGFGGFGGFVHSDGRGDTAEACAASVSARGALFAPDPSRRAPPRGFRALRGPASIRARRAASCNAREVRAVVAAAHGGDFSVGSDAASAAAETLPMLRVIASAGAAGAARVPYLPSRWVGAGEDPPRVDASDPSSSFERDAAVRGERVRAAPRPGEDAGAGSVVRRGGRGGRGDEGALGEPSAEDEEDEIEDDDE